MNRLSLSRRTQVINCLVEGNSIRSTERMTDTHRDTVMRLLVEIGEGCRKVMDAEMRNLTCRRIQVDEIWAFVGKKQRHLAVNDDRSRVVSQFVETGRTWPAGLTPSRCHVSSSTLLAA